MTLNDTIRTLLAHSSVRDFTSEPVSQEDRDAIIEVARAASSSCFLQCVSIIRVTDPAKRAKLVEYTGGQKHVAVAPEFWVFCADYHRCRQMIDTADTGWTEQFLVGVQDAGIMAQNAFAALESLGLGGVYAGGLRTCIREVDELLELPDLVIPVVGLAFGHPASRNEVKERLPVNVLVSENTYRVPAQEELDEYDRRMSEYYANRPVNAKKINWSDSCRRILGRERRPFVLEYLRSKGFALK